MDRGDLPARAALPVQPATRAALLTGIVLLAAVLRIAGLERQSYTMDEVTELSISERSVSEIIVIADGFPPLYHLALKGWRTIGAPRALSILLGLVTVLAVFLLGRELGGERAAVATAALAAISPFQIWFAQEARAYALVLPLAALALWLFAHASRTDSRASWYGYALVAALGTYSHYYFGMLVALNAVWLLVVRTGRWSSMRRALAAHVVLAVITVPLAGIFVADLAHQAGTRDTTLSPLAFAYTLHTFLLGFSAGPSLRELHIAAPLATATAMLPWTSAVLLCLAPLLPSFLGLLRDERHRMAWLLTLVSGPMAMCLAASGMLAVKYKVSYLAWASIPALTLLGWTFARAVERSALARWGALACLVLLVISLAGRHLNDRYRNEALHEVAAFIEAGSNPEIREVLVSPPYMSAPLRHYLEASWSIRPLAVDEPLPTNSWLMYSRPFHGDPDGTLLRRLEDADDVTLARTFAGIDLFLTGRDAPEPVVRP